ncbi:MAG: acylglycerol kinase family protein, partial [Clostridia bacterium]
MYYIIINPIAGKGNSLRALKTVETILIGKKTEYEVLRTTHPGHASELTKEICDKNDENSTIIALGGDGTYNEILNGITDFTKVIVGFIPCGTGNDYVKATKIPKITQEALELILKGDVCYTDFIQLENKRALNCTGSGMDVDVLLRYARMKAFHGKIKYYASLIDTLFHLKFHKM